MQTINEKMDALIAIQEYEAAYLLGANILAQHQNNEEAVNALCSLTAKLRSDCNDLAFKQRDNSTEYHDLEALLIKTNLLTHQDMNGAFLTSSLQN
ncbi:hypothetical protein [Marinicellulosiphila megalodicopiae]|uniref:hypothetical protein n=1 Tax=Marinicellulosiphila megalodicopiae TaxID=2724896 RepID=UPI003BB0FC53